MWIEYNLPMKPKSDSSVSINSIIFTVETNTTNEETQGKLLILDVKDNNLIH